MICPYCAKDSIKVEEWMKRNAENYGGSNFNFRCPKCKEMVGVPIRIQVVVGEPYKSDAKEES